MSNKKQTVVDWLLEELVRMDKLLDGKRKNEDSTILKSNPTKIYKQAKEMEKQQIKDAYVFGLQDEYVIGSENYYRETYENHST